MSTVFRHSYWPLILVAIIAGFSTGFLTESSARAQAPAFGGEPFELTSKFQSYEGSNKGLLTVTATVETPWHIYSLTQPDGGPLKSKIALEPSDEFSLTSEFEPDSDPHVSLEETFPDVDIESHEGTVNWSASIEFAEGVDPKELAIEIAYSGLRCADTKGCIPISVKSVANFAGEIKAVDSDAPFRSEGSHVLISGAVTNPAGADKALMPGDDAILQITLEPVDGYHVYQYSVNPDPEGSKMYTLIGVAKKNDWEFAGVETVAPAADKVATEGGVKKYKAPVTFKIPFKIAKDAEKKVYKIGGVLGFQTCIATDEQNTCDRPSGSRWEAMIPVGVTGDEAVSSNLRITEDPVDYIKVIAPEVKKLNADQSDAGAWSGYSPWVVLPLAFVAGFILNFMPCVLPVVGLKIMSFMHMAGENPRRVFMLNFVFVLGMLAVFMTFAALAIMFNFGWGEAYTNLTFKVAMIAIVFAFGLSFFGVWEIPMPGLVDSDAANDLANKEGYTGQFFKGILTTLLATPCSGPMLIPAVVWAMAQPAAMTLTVFLFLGLGMALPYLVIGAFPKLASFLPKPGPWMDTFKQIMGFIMLATAIFLINGVGSKYNISVLTLLLFIGVGCWWVGRTETHEPLMKQLKAWTGGALLVAVGAAIAFLALLPWYELEYQPYSDAAVAQHLAEGRTVIVDFTADW